MPHYAIVTDSSLPLFLTAVNEKVAQGYRPVGGLVVARMELYGAMVDTLYQALFRDDPPAETRPQPPPSAPPIKRLFGGTPT